MLRLITALVLAALVAPTRRAGRAQEGRPERGRPEDAWALREQGWPGSALAGEERRRLGAGRRQREVPGRRAQLQQESLRLMLALWRCGEVAYLTRK